jgi:hypothetical protein
MLSARLACGRRSLRLFSSSGKDSLNFSQEASKTPGREYLLDDSRRGYEHNEKFGQPFDAYHDARDTLRGRDPNYKHPKVISERGQKWVEGADMNTLASGHWPEWSRDLPFTSRKKTPVWGNYSLVMKAEFLFFYIPALLITALIIPIFTMTFAFDETVYTTMTVKVMGRQWYWIYDVESPAEEEEE